MYYNLRFPLKFSDTSKFEKLNPHISVNILILENNEVFPLRFQAPRQETSRKLADDFQQRSQVPLPARQGLVRSRRRPQ